MTISALLLLAATSLAGLVSGAPYLGGQLYQSHVEPYVYLNQNPLLYQSLPYNQVYSVPSHQHIVSPSVPSHHHVYDLSSSVPSHHHIYDVSSQLLGEGSVQPGEQVAEINQFHSDDGQGRVLYGFHGHNQARMEARDAQGRVRGSYSYIDPNGHVVRMDYWDDGSGFQARGSNVPKVTYELPGYTPEVQAAREQHFKLYQQILLSSVHTQPPYQVPVDDYPYVERPDGASTSPSSQDEEDDTVEVGLYPNSPNDLPTYPGGPMRLPGNYQRPTYQFQDEEDLESIALDNPEFQDLGRSGKSLEVKDSKQEGTNQNDKMEPVGKDTEEKKDQDKDNTKEKVDNKKEETMDKAKEGTTENKDDSKREEMIKQNENDGKHGGFSYHFQYNLGAPSKLQVTPNFQKVSSVAASEPVSQGKTTSVHSVHPLPLHTMTGFAAGPAAIHDAQVSPHQLPLQHQLSQMIIKSLPSPAAAVHDSQVPQKSNAFKGVKTDHN